MASQAKQAVNDFLGKDSHHTTVHESSAPAVTDEHVKPHRHENVTTAVNREVHQDHHHTTVQPIQHSETLPEKHHHNVVPVEHKTFEHGNESDVRNKLEQEAARFKNTSTTHDTTHSSTTAPTAESERVHHHVHEHVQPVIHKETVQPHVVHTTVPVHETHHASAQHHGTSTLPVKSLDEFKSSGGILDGKNATHHGDYDGCPRPYNTDMQSEQTAGDKDMHHSHHHDHAHHANDVTHTRHNDAHRANDAAHTKHNDTTQGQTPIADSMSHSTSHATADSTTHKKPSLLSKLNPLKDADGDGKKGFMD